MRSILIPINFKKNSYHILEKALTLFPIEKTRFILLHTYSVRPTNELLISLDDIIERDLKQKLEQKALFIRSMAKSENVDIITICEQGELVTSITNAALKYNAEILVFGIDGRESSTQADNSKDRLALDIIGAVNLPTLVIPRNKQIHHDKV